LIKVTFFVLIDKKMLVNVKIVNTLNVDKEIL